MCAAGQDPPLYLASAGCVLPPRREGWLHQSGATTGPLVGSFVPRLPSTPLRGLADRAVSGQSRMMVLWRRAPPPLVYLRQWPQASLVRYSTINPRGSGVGRGGNSRGRLLWTFSGVEPALLAGPAPAAVPPRGRCRSWKGAPARRYPPPQPPLPLSSSHLCSPPARARRCRPWAESHWEDQWRGA